MLQFSSLIQLHASCAARVLRAAGNVTATGSAFAVHVRLSSTSSPDNAGSSQVPETTAAQAGTNNAQATASSTASGSADAKQQQQLQQSTIKQEATASGLRSLTDVFGDLSTTKLTASDQAIAQLEAETLAALTGGAALPQQPAEASSSKAEPADELLHPTFGYAAIGGYVPQDRGSAAKLDLLSAHPRVHPQRTFNPGQTYEPEDLNPYASASSSRVTKRRGRQLPGADEVATYADYKNVAFLEKFLSPAGRLQSKRITKLPVLAHVKVMREIKIARTMGLIAGETRLDKLHLRRVREAEAFAVQQSGQA